MAGEIDKGSAQLILLKEINEAANRGVALSGILQSAVEGVAEIFNYPACDIFLLEDKDVLRYANITIDSNIIRAVEKLTGITVDGYNIKLFEGSCFKEVIDTKAPVILDDMVRVFEAFAGGERKLAKFAPAVAKIAGFKWVIRVPLLSNDRVLGILGAATNKDMADVDIPALELFASNLAVIIERKQMEEELISAKENLEVKVEERTQELKVSEEKYSTLVECGNDGIVIIQDGVLKFINPKVSELAGFPSSEVIGRAFMDFVDPEFKGLVLKRYEKRMNGEQVPSKYEINILSKDGRKIPVEVSASVIEYMGRPADMGIMRDITERKKAEEALKVSEKKYRDIVDNTIVGVYQTNLNGDVLYVNDAMARIAGLSSTTEMKELRSVLRYKDPKRRDELIEILRRRGRVDDFEFEAFDKNDRLKNILISATLDGDLISGIMLDITERKRTEEELAKYRYHLEELVKDRTKELSHARDSLVSLVEELTEATHDLESANLKLQESDRLKTVFLASVSHELRTPLNSIIGFTGLMLQGLSGKLNEEQKKQLGIVNSNARHLLALIEDLLDISKIEAGRMAVEPTYFDMQKAVSEVVEIFTPKTRERVVRIVENTSEIVVHSDVKRFKQVLTNLVDNAVKFTAKGEITVSTAPGGGTVTVSVEDTGIGIKAEDLPLLFQSFQRVNPPIDSVTEGSGLGLYLSQKIANMLGGEITVTSTYNKGSTFTLTIPADISQGVR